jgi:hypothetical protein
MNHKTVILTLASLTTWDGTSDHIVTDIHQLKLINDGRIYFKTDGIDT